MTKTHQQDHIQPRERLFPDFSDCWTPIARSADLGDGPLARVVAGQPIVLFRTAEREPVALLDRCPHRRVKLSIGSRTPAGSLRCAFHGWEFGAEGRCLRIPLVQNPRCEAVRATAFPCVELGGLVWLFTGVAEANQASAPWVPESLLVDGWGSVYEQSWSVHWSRAVQTMLDVAHIPFVHPTTIGVAFRRDLDTGEGAIAYDMRSGEGGRFSFRWSAAGQSADQTVGVSFAPPNGVMLDVPTRDPERVRRLHIWCVPAEAGRSRMFVITRRNYGRLNPIQIILDHLTPLILREDRQVMETAWPSEVSKPGLECSSPADLPTIAFARYYDRTFRRPA